MIDDSELLVKEKHLTDDNFGIYPNKRSLTQLIEKGFVVIDKDSGPTSHTVADNIVKILDCEKAGHSGTLDPKVTGVLVMGLGKATRLMEYMLKSDKVYVMLMYLHKEINIENLKNTIKNFTGTIKQIPPIVSAVKRQERERTIYSIKLLDSKENNQYVLLRVSCQHGTYMRKLATDMANDLNVGGQMVELRRIKAGPFTEKDNMISLDNLRNLWELYNEELNIEKKIILEIELRKYIKPMEYLLKDLKKVYVFDSSIYSLTYGFDLMVPGVSMLSEGIEINEEIAIFSLKGELIAIGKAQMSSDEIMVKKKGMCIKTNKVFLEKGIYPKF